MSIQLTDAQKAIIDSVKVKWTAIGSSTEPINRERAAAALSVAYEKLAGQPCPHIEWAAGIREASQIRARYIVADPNHDKDPEQLRKDAWALTPEQFDHELDRWSDGRLGGGAWASWHGWAEALRKLDVEGIERVDYVNAVAEEVSFWWPYDKVCIVAERPNVLTTDDRDRLHGEGAPAVSWPDGYAMWFHHGVHCTERIIKGEFEARDIIAEDNAERRRAMCEIKGWAAILEGLEATKVSADEYGTVWHVDLNRGLPEWDRDEGNEALLVEVLNSTPEPDGSIKTYFLSVDPVECKGLSATDCIGWTFHLAPGQYRPEKMT